MAAAGEKSAGKASAAQTGVDPGSLTLCKALSHQTRVAILTLLVERGEAVSPIEMSRILRQHVGEISHHCKQLVKYECAEEVATRQVRGATEHFYIATRPPIMTREDWELLAPPVKNALSGIAFKMIAKDAVEAIEEGTMDSLDERVLVRYPMMLDGPGFSEMHDIMERALEEAQGVQARSKERLEASAEQPMRVAASMMCFEMPQAST